MLFPPGQKSQRSLLPQLSIVAKEEAALNLQLKQYKEYYLNRIVQPSRNQNYIRVLKQLKILLVSYCKTIAYIDIENIVSKMDELGVIMDDLINKYEVLTLQPSDNNKQEQKQNQSELCSICSQPIQKANIERLRMHILQENISRTYHQNDEDDLSEIQEDINFFQEVKNLLSSKQSQIFQNQKKISHYHNIANNSLNALMSIQKDLFNRQSETIPNRGWMEEAKRQMQFLLKDYFKGKVPPFIQKMFTIFQQLTHRHRLSLQQHISVQTETNTNSELFELKRKNLMSNTKITQFESRTKIQQKQLMSVNNEKIHLQTKIEYMQTEIKQLMNEIDRLKEQNKIVENKLDVIRKRQRYDVGQSSNCNGSDEVIFVQEEEQKENSKDTLKTFRSSRKKTTFKNQSNPSQNKIFPKIKVLDEKRNIKRKSRTSILMNQHSTHSFQAHHLSTNHSPKNSTRLIQKSSRGFIHDEIRSSYGDSSKTSRQDIRQSSPGTPHKKGLLSVDPRPFLSKTIVEVDNESNQCLDPSKGTIQTQSKQSIPEKQFHYLKQQEKAQLKAQLSKILKKVNKNGDQKMARTSMPLPKLKKTFHKKRLFQLSQQHDISKNIDEKLDQIGGLYQELKDRGHLVQLSEEDFRFIIKIKSFDFGQVEDKQNENISESKIQKKKKVRTQKQDSLNSSRRDWNNQHYQTYQGNQTIRSSSFNTPKTVAKHYSALFTTQQNAYNYETSLTKNHTRGGYSMTKPQQALCQQLYSHLNELQINNEEQYKLLCSFLRYPYQTMQNRTAALMQNNILKYNTLEHYFQRIASIHSHCKKVNGICHHLIQLRDKIARDAVICPK